jgi:hypothetical protein
VEFDFFSIDKTAYKVNDFISWQRIGSLSLSPSFQRRPVWSKSAKSFLIDTVSRGLPIPIIILRERLDLNTIEPLREVVDGQQRLRTLISYIEPKLLEDYDSEKDDFSVSRTHNKSLARKSFRQLSSKIKQRILNYSFSVHVLPSDTSDQDVLQIFARLNSTGTKLNGQELRNAQFFGEFKQLAYSLAHSQLNRWRDWGIFSENDIARMIEVEETSDAMLLILEGNHGKTQAVLNRLYKKFEDEFEHSAEVAKRFNSVMDMIDETFGLRLRHTVFSRKALFHTLFAFTYDQMYGLKSKLIKKSPKKLNAHYQTAVFDASDIIKHGEVPDDLDKTLRAGTSDVGSRQIRIDFLKKVYKNVSTK